MSGAATAAEATDKIAAARVYLLKEKPFLGVLARALRVEPSPAVTAFRLHADDRLEVRPEAVLALRFPALVARLAHLALHAALGAFARRAARDPRRWNVAHDLAVDPLLRAAGLGVAAGLPPADLPEGASAEEHYAHLPEGARPADDWCDLADPPPRPDAPAAGRFTRERDEAGSPLAMRAQELAWRMRLAAALQEEIAAGGKTFGERPAWIDELVQATVAPPPDWSVTLQRSLSTLTRTDRTYLRPSRRMSALAGPTGSPELVTMPGRRVRPAGRLVAIIDTSASLGAATLARFLGTLAAAATAEGIEELRLVQADAAVTRDEALAASELILRKIAIVGRGGTDFGPALRMLAREARGTGERWTAVYLTDLDGRLPEAAETAGVDVLWVVPGKAAHRPPFGLLLEMRAAERP
jgi:predicted metal-dependent peptidase